MIAVSDTGTGIPLAIRDKVFEPFFTTKDVGKGAGLGLSMIYGFIKQSNGDVEIDSEEGRGTTIRLYLPRSEVEAAAAEPRATLLTGGSETILAVEDDDLVRNYVLAQLESLGYATLSARNSAEALSLVDQGAEFDLLFTDMIMPAGVSGDQLASEVLKRRPSVKVLYTSGYTDRGVESRAPPDPAVCFLNKPYRKVDLAQKIREALGSRSGLVAAKG